MEAALESGNHGRRAVAPLPGVLLAGMCLILFTVQASAHGEVHDVIAKVTEQIASEPNKAELFLRRAELYRVDADWAAAEADYLRAEQLDPQLAAVDLARGRLLENLGQSEKACLAFNRYIERQPADPAGFEARAHASRNLEKLAAAADDFGKAIALSREPGPDLFLNHARALNASGRNEQARATLEEGLRRLGPLATLTLLAVDLDRAAGHFDDAIRRIDAAAGKLTRKERWLVRRAEILWEAGRRDEARDSYLLARASIESLPEARRGMAMNAELLQKIDAALSGERSREQ